MSRLFTLPSGRTAKWVVAAVFLLVSIPIAALSGKFEDAQKNESSSFLPGKAESIKALDAIEQYPDGELAPAVIVFERREGLTDADKQRIEQTVAKLNQDRPELVLEAQAPVYSRNGASAIIRTCSGVVPQHPPTRLIKPARANSPRSVLVISGVSS